MFNFMDKDDRYSKYKIGRFTYGDPRVIDCWTKPPDVTLQVGNFCSFASGVTIWLGGNHHTEWVSTSPLNHFLGYDQNKSTCHRFDQIGTKGKVVIGNDVWIGADVTILSGVSIGDGAVIGTKSVVSKSVPSYAVVAGNPAQVVRTRFSSPQIAALLNIAWWNWDDQKIKENIPLILSPNIQKFIDRHVFAV